MTDTFVNIDRVVVPGDAPNGTPSPFGFGWGNVEGTGERVMVYNGRDAMDVALLLCTLAGETGPVPCTPDMVLRGIPEPVDTDKAQSERHYRADTALAIIRGMLAIARATRESAIANGHTDAATADAIESSMAKAEALFVAEVTEYSKDEYDVVWHATLVSTEAQMRERLDF